MEKKVPGPELLHETPKAMIITQTHFNIRIHFVSILLLISPGIGVVGVKIQCLFREGERMADLNFPNAVTDVKDYYGRLDGLRLIEETFLQNQRVPVLVIGERRTGKTSLMNVAIRRLQGLSEKTDAIRFVILPVEPRGIVTFGAFARAILLRMSAHQGSDASETQPGGSIRAHEAVPEIDGIEQFEAHFTGMLRNHQRETFLVCIDEFDEIVRQTHGPELARILGLINSLLERADLPISFFFTMTRVPDLLKEEFPSTLISMAQVLELRPLEIEELTRLVNEVTGGRLSWAEERLQHLFQACGGHPYFTKLVLSHVLQSCPDCGEPTRVTQVVFEDAIQQALNDPRTDHVFENLYKVHFSAYEKEVVLLLARRQTPLPGKELGNVGAAWVTAARRLVKRHYLVDQGGYYFRAAFMGDWLRNWIAFEEECALYSTLQKRLAVPREIEVNLTTGQVSVLGVPVRLSAQEFAILDFLSERGGQLVHREALVDRVWGTDQGVSDQVIDTAFYRLRKKIADQGQYIETVPGQGFKLNRAVRIAEAMHRQAAKEGGVE